MEKSNFCNTIQKIKTGPGQNVWKCLKINIYVWMDQHCHSIFHSDAGTEPTSASDILDKQFSRADVRLNGGVIGVAAEIQE